MCTQTCEKTTCSLWWTGVKYTRARISVQLLHSSRGEKTLEMCIFGYFTPLGVERHWNPSEADSVYGLLHSIRGGKTRQGLLQRKAQTEALKLFHAFYFSYQLNKAYVFLFCECAHAYFILFLCMFLFFCEFLFYKALCKGAI